MLPKNNQEKLKSRMQLFHGWFSMNSVSSIPENVRTANSNTSPELRCVVSAPCNRYLRNIFLVNKKEILGMKYLFEQKYLCIDFY